MLNILCNFTLNSQIICMFCLSDGNEFQLGADTRKGRVGHSLPVTDLTIGPLGSGFRDGNDSFSVINS